MSLYDKYGGHPAIADMVMKFYDRVRTSPELDAMFAGVDMQRLIDHQAQFICSLIGGPASYSDEELRGIHAPLGVTGHQFDTMMSLFKLTLEECRFQPEDVAEIFARMNSKRSFVVAAKEPAQSSPL